jgi:hypothetical protein
MRQKIHNILPCAGGLVWRAQQLFLIGDDRPGAHGGLERGVIALRLIGIGDREVTDGLVELVT